MKEARLLALLVALTGCSSTDSHVPEQKSGTSESGGAETACVEEVESLDDTEPNARSLLSILSNAHESPMKWRDEQETRVELVVKEAHVQRVQSHASELDDTDRGSVCRDRVRVEAQITLRTADGRLDQGVEGALFEVEDDGKILRSHVEIDARELPATYAPQAEETQTPSKLLIEMTVSASRFGGEIAEEYRAIDGVSRSPAIALW